MCAERDWSGKRVIGSGAVSGREKIGWSGSERLQSGERSGERSKLAAQISLKGDTSLLKLRKSILSDVKNREPSGILIPISNTR